MENPESDPRLGGTRRSAAAATPWNRIANRPESKHELRLCPFGACSSGQLLPRKFPPYAIPLPFSGGGLGWGANLERPGPAHVGYDYRLRREITPTPPALIKGREKIGSRAASLLRLRPLVLGHGRLGGLGHLGRGQVLLVGRDRPAMAEGIQQD